MTKIVFAYAATGKTYAANNHSGNILDFVTMPYSYNLPKLEDSIEVENLKGTYGSDYYNDDWPYNYLEDLEKIYESGEYDYILCPSNSLLIEYAASFDCKPSIVVVIPGEKLQDEYRERFLERGSVELVKHLIDGKRFSSIIRSVESTYDFIRKFDNDIDIELIKLSSGQYLLDVLKAGVEYE